MSQDILQDIGKKYGVSLETVNELAAELDRTGGLSVQFNNQELGGKGRWTLNGGAQVGNGFNTALNKRVDALMRDLWEFITAADDHPSEELSKTLPPMPALKKRTWWPDAWETPDTSGTNNGLNYAYFSSRNRLALRQGVKVRFFDTSGYSVRSVSIQRDMGQPIITVNTSQGRVDISTFKEVRE